MTYETGQTDNVDTLLVKVRDFALAQGFTLEAEGDRLDGYGKYIALRHSVNGIYTLYTDHMVDSWSTQDPKPYMYIRMSPDYDNALLPWAQVSQSGEARSNGTWGDFEEYHLFGDSDNIYCVIEVSSGVYCHFGFGMHEKSWDYTGGQFIYALKWNYRYDSTSSSSNYRTLTSSNRHSMPFDQNSRYNRATICRCDIEGVSNRYFTNYEDSSTTAMIGGYPRGVPPLGVAYFTYSPSSTNAVAPLFPILNAVRLSSKTRFVGTVNGITSVNIANYEGGDIIEYGNDRWMVFPAKKKHTTTPAGDDVSSGTYGYAFRM